MLVSQRFVDLLVLRRPEALIILAYYGVALHTCNLWIIGDTGKDIVNAVNNYLAPRWDSWLRWPCESVGIKYENTLNRTARSPAH